MLDWAATIWLENRHAISLFTNVHLFLWHWFFLPIMLWIVAKYIRRHNGH